MATLEKSKDKAFIDQIKNFDIILLSETHIGYDTNINIEGFLYYSFCREKSNNNRFFGGILIKKNIRKGIALLQNYSSEFHWMKLRKDYFNLKNNIFLCLAYIAPNSSKFNNNTDYSTLELIERDIVEKYGNQGDIIIAGDLNARIGNERDFILDDGTPHIPIDIGSYRVDATAADRFGCDIVVDTRGKDILELCISNQLRVLNGRTFGDSTGKYTCFNYAGCSVVDFFILSEQLLEDILYMSVSDFIPLLSDCHCKISMKLLSSFQREYKNNYLKKFPDKYICNQDSLERFQAYFTHPSVKQELSSFLESNIESNETSINKASTALCEIIDKVANITLKKKVKKKKCQNKNWYDFDLRKQRKLLNEKALLMSKYPKNPFIRGAFH
jgi:hypothetical protein